MRVSVLSLHNKMGFVVRGAASAPTWAPEKLHLILANGNRQK